MDPKERILFSDELTQLKTTFLKSHDDPLFKLIQFYNKSNRSLEDSIYDVLRGTSENQLIYPLLKSPFNFTEWEKDYEKLKKSLTPIQKEDIYFRTCDKLIDFIHNVLGF